MEWLIALAGVAFGAVLTWALGLDQTRRMHRRAAAYVSRRIVAALDEFVIGSARVVNGEPTRSEEDYDYHWPTPGSLKLPADGDWTSLETADMEAAMRLAVRVDLAQSEVSVTTHYDHGAAYEALADLYSRLGLDADELASRLRRKYRIGDRESQASWDPIAELRTARAKTERRAEPRQAD